MRWSSPVREHLRLLSLFNITIRLLSYLILFLSTFLPQFDSSPKIVTQSRWSSPLSRWDAFHFAHIAEKGYVYEYEWAFLPGIPLLMRFVAQALHYMAGSEGPLTWDDLFRGGALAALACDSTHTLYHLSLHHLGSPNLAFLASLLSLMPSSPATLHFAAYSEPFFTYLSYKGESYPRSERN
jgi:phosphatidylinositol glycan class V